MITLSVDIQTQDEQLVMTLVVNGEKVPDWFALIGEDRRKKHMAYIRVYHGDKCVLVTSHTLTAKSTDSQKEVYNTIMEGLLVKARELLVNAYAEAYDLVAAVSDA